MTAPAPDAVLHLAALHTLAATGFASTSRAASVMLSSTLARYLRLVALTCTEKASLAGRNKVAAVDVIEALEELGVGGVGELQEWAVGLDQEVSFSTPGLGLLGQDNREGLGVDEELARLKLVRNEELSEVDEDEDAENGEIEVTSVKVEEDQAMDVDMEEQAEHATLDSTRSTLRFASPDFSWLPPLPDERDVQEIASTAHTTEDSTAASTAAAPALSIIDRYRRRIPFSQSQLATARPFVDPPAIPPASLPSATSSFPSLVKAFEETKRDPSATLRQTALRQQASELLRRKIAMPDEYSPEDTLVVPLPGPRSTPIIPSHSLTDSIPLHPIPLNPAPTGLLSRLVHNIHSPHLPPSLRDRLTSVRPPMPQSRDGEPILYGEPVRGPSEAALARARGKAQEADQADQGLLQATWQAPARGSDKWGRRLAKGRKVIQSGEGEERPRVPEGNRPAGTPGAAAASTSDGNAGGDISADDPAQPQTPATPGGSVSGSNKVRLRISASGSTLNVPNGDSARLSPNTMGPPSLSPSPSAQTSSVPATSPNHSTERPSTPSAGTPGPTSVKLTLPKRASDSLSPGAAPNGTSPAPNSSFASASPRPILSLKLGPRSASPLKPMHSTVTPEVKIEPLESRQNQSEQGAGHVNGHGSANGGANGHGL